MDKDLVANYINGLKKKTGLTYEAIAEKSKRSESTVKKGIIMSVRFCERDAGTCYNSSSILLYHLKQYHNVLSPWTLSKLHQYNNLYNSYCEKHMIVTSLEKKYLNYKSTHNPFKIIKKLKLYECLLEEYRTIYTIIIEMAEIEAIKQIQEILNKYNEYPMFSIAHEVIGKCHFDRSLYIH